MILAGELEERGKKKMWEGELQAGKKERVYEEAGCGFEGFVTRKAGKDGKDPGQLLVQRDRKEVRALRLTK